MQVGSSLLTKKEMKKDESSSSSCCHCSCCPSSYCSCSHSFLLFLHFVLMVFESLCEKEKRKKMKCDERDDGCTCDDVFVVFDVVFVSFSRDCWG